MKSFGKFVRLVVVLQALAACALDRGAGMMCDIPLGSGAEIVAQSSFNPLDGETRGFAPSMALDDDEVVPNISGVLRSSAQRGASRANPRPQKPIEIEVLSLSAGGQYGSFGAGFLRGWAQNASRPRPNFDLVTGVSAGGMLAPVAFSGQTNDAALDKFRGLDSKDVFQRRALAALGTSPSVYDPKPLEEMLRALLTDEMIADIARNHRDGARLLVMAVDLDSTRARVFDLGQMAASSLPLESRRDCMTEVMLASAAIPGVFPPRNIDGTLYADGGLRDQIFLRAVETARAQLAKQTGRPVKINTTIVVNGSLRPPAGKVRDSLLGYAERSLLTLSDEILRDSIIETISFAEANEGWVLRGVIADLDVEELCPLSETVGTFDKCVTTALFDHGMKMGQKTPVDFLTAKELRALAEEL